MKIDVVIGSGYGDEGKGHVVSELAKSESTVVRFNGGAQAGHTVEYGPIRHVFSHFGSGTFNGAKTHLSSFFVVSPRHFQAELQQLKGFYPVVTVDPECYVTTPYDVILNMMAEESRGSGRHGSVGIGFGETIERNERNHLYGLKARNMNDVKDVMLRISKEWIPERADELGIDLRKFPEFHRTLTSLDTIETFQMECNYFLSHVAILPDRFLKDEDHLVFEGAQGLLLDQELGDFPYVTRSNTGLKNVSKLLHEIGSKVQEDVYYVSRPYTTRHGAGPMCHELLGVPYGLYDKTNVTGPYQGHLRYSYLDLPVIHKAVNTDIMVNASVNANFHAVMTCMDQMPERVHVHTERGFMNCDKVIVPGMFGKLFAKNIYITTSPQGKLELFMGKEMPQNANT